MYCRTLIAANVPRVCAMKIEKDKQGLPKFGLPNAKLKTKMAKARRYGMLVPPAVNKRRDAAIKTLAKEMLNRLQLLCKFYGIASSPRQYIDLALRLAIDFVPNFDLIGRNQSAGAPIKNTIVSDAVLVHEVDEMNHNRQRGVADACRILSKRNRDWKGIKPTTLQTRYYAAKARVNATIKKTTKIKP